MAAPAPSSALPYGDSAKPAEMLQSPLMSPGALMASRDEDFVGVILAFEQALAGAMSRC